jgi:hypothetical protein
MAYNKTTWENAPSTNTPINANNLNKIEEGIYQNSLKADQIGDITNLNTTDKSNIVNAINELKDAEVYSTSEVKTNKVWIDGKPIYRTVLYATNLATSTQFSTGITNLDTWVSLNYIASVGNKSGDVVVQNSYASSSSYNRAFLSYSDTEIRWRSATSGMYAYFILEYTKTTD